MNFENYILWCDYHKFNWKIKNDKFYWQTNIACGELSLSPYIVNWYDREYFNIL